MRIFSGAHLQALAGQDMGDPGAQRTVAAAFTVLQGIYPVAAHHGLEHFAEILRRELAGIADAVGKADRMGVTGGLEHFVRQAGFCHDVPGLDILLP